MHAHLHAATVEKKIIELGLYCLAACGKNTCAVMTDADAEQRCYRKEKKEIKQRKKRTIWGGVVLENDLTQK
jgi:hypothetical protein